MSDADIESLSEFDVETMLSIIASLLQSKKLIFASNKGENAEMTMLSVRDLLFKKCGFQWPHLFATSLPVAQDYETVS